MGSIVTDNITATNNLVKACAILIGRKLGLKPRCKRIERKEPWWKRRINQSIKEIRRHINLLERKRRGDLKKTEKYKMIEQKYKVKSKGLGIVLEELKQRLQAKSMKIKRYDQRIQQYTLNRLFHQDQKRVYQQLNGETNSDVKPDAVESRKFWSNIWDSNVHHRKDAEWLRELRACKDDRKQETITITVEMVTQQTRRIPYWK